MNSTYLHLPHVLLYSLSVLQKNFENFKFYKTRIHFGSFDKKVEVIYWCHCPLHLLLWLVSGSSFNTVPKDTCYSLTISSLNDVLSRNKFVNKCILFYILHDKSIIVMLQKHE